MSHPHQTHNERRPPPDKHRRFEDDGDAVETEHLWTWCDRYLEIAQQCDGPLSPEGFQALENWKRSWGR